MQHHEFFFMFFYACSYNFDRLPNKYILVFQSNKWNLYPLLTFAPSGNLDLSTIPVTYLLLLNRNFQREQMLLNRGHFELLKILLMNVLSQLHPQKFKLIIWILHNRKSSRAKFSVANKKKSKRSHSKQMNKKEHKIHGKLQRNEMYVNKYLLI